MSKRSSSSKLFFYDLHGGGAKVQVMADARYQFVATLSVVETCFCLLFISLLFSISGVIRVCINFMENNVS